MNSIKNISIGLLLSSWLSLPLMGAQAVPAVPVRSDKDEKEMHALADQEQTLAQIMEEENTAAYIRDIPERMPLIIPEQRQVKDKEGKPLEEFLMSTDAINEGEPLRSFMETTLKKKEMVVIARVVAPKPDNKGLAIRYHAATEQVKEFYKTKPVNELAYYVYVPEYARFELAYIEPSDPARWISMAQIQEVALYEVGDSLNKVKHNKKSRAIFRHLSEHGTHIKIKRIAQLDLVPYLLEGYEGPKDVAKARTLLESLVVANADQITTRAHAYLAVGFYKGIDDKLWPQNNQQAREHALKAIKSRHYDGLELLPRTETYYVAGHTLMCDLGHSQVGNALGYLEKALVLAEKLNNAPLKARIHACLALCYYNTPRFGTGVYADGEGRYTKAWHHCTQALEQYEAVETIASFLELVAEMQYFALGNEGDPKKALEYIAEINSDTGTVFNSSRLHCITYHRDYYHTSKEEPAKKKEAREGLQQLILDYGDRQNPFFFTMCALLGEMYVYEAEEARKQAEIYRDTDRAQAHEYTRLADDLDARAKQNFAYILSMSEAYRSSHAQALTHLMMGHRELHSPVCDYAKAANHFRTVTAQPKEVPMLASDANTTLSDLERRNKISKKFPQGEIHPRDPRVAETCFHRMMTDFNNYLSSGIRKDDGGCFKEIVRMFGVIANNAPKGSLVRMQAAQAFNVAQEHAPLMSALSEAYAAGNKAVMHQILTKLTKSPNKHMQKHAIRLLDMQAAQAFPSASFSLDPSLDAPVVGPLPMPVVCWKPEDPVMDVGTDERRHGTKRKAENPPDDPRALRAQDDNGAGSGSAAV